MKIKRMEKVHSTTYAYEHAHTVSLPPMHAPHNYTCTSETHTLKYENAIILQRKHNTMPIK